MIKQIKLNESHSIDINSSMGWLFIYRSTFGHDILPDLMPIIESIISGMAEILEDVDDSGNIDVKTIAGSISDGTLNNALATFSTMEFITIIQIVWSMAKNADKSIPSIYEWAEGIENFPIDEILPELFEAITESMISSKNAKSLQTKIEAMKNKNTSI